MTILYLHGLESTLSPAKRAVLERFGTVIAPDLDYHNNSTVFDLLLKQYQNKEINVVIGSSMGGFMGYYIANTISRPALLFNPALTFRPVEQRVPELDFEKTTPLIHFALGGHDDIVKANDNLKFISENRNSSTDIKISIHSQMQHQIPLTIFENEVANFFSKLF